MLAQGPKTVCPDRAGHGLGGAAGAAALRLPGHHRERNPASLCPARRMNRVRRKIVRYEPPMPMRTIDAGCGQPKPTRRMQRTHDLVST